MIAANETLAPESKSRRRSVARATARPAASKTKVTLCLSADLATRLAVHAAVLGEERSTIVDALIRDHLKRFRVQDLARDPSRDNGEDRKSDAA